MLDNIILFPRKTIFNYAEILPPSNFIGNNLRQWSGWRLHHLPRNLEIRVPYLQAEAIHLERKIKEDGLEHLQEEETNQTKKVCPLLSLLNYYSVSLDIPT